MSNWVRLHNTVVREGDIRRIEMEHVPDLGIVFTITFRDGKAMRISSDKQGGDWCMKAMKTTSECNEEITDSHSLASSEFSE